MKPAVRLRRSTPADLAYVTQLERNAENRPQIGQWSDAEHLAAMAGEQGREQWIFERDGAPAGYLIAYDRRASEGCIYVKRVLVDAKGQGTGKAAMTAFLAEAFARPGTQYVWLTVRDENLRAQSVYLDVGFERWEPTGEESARADRMGEPRMANTFRMRIGLSAWRSRAR